jgi:hypothetical protein
MKMRPIGFYWLWWSEKVGWQAGYWTGKDWKLVNTMQTFQDEDFLRITSPITEPWTGYTPQE